jgi:hypothetical protein
MMTNNQNKPDFNDIESIKKMAQEYFGIFHFKENAYPTPLTSTEDTIEFASDFARFYHEQQQEKPAEKIQLPKNIKPRDVFYQTLADLGFDKCLPSELTNSDYWMVTNQAMINYHEQQQEKLSEKMELPKNINSFNRMQVVEYAQRYHGQKMKNVIQKMNDLYATKFGRMNIHQADGYKKAIHDLTKTEEA